jgi:type I restriction enzyme R subunit
VVDNDRDLCRASSGEHLSSLLAQHKSHIFSLIQKFKSFTATPSPLSPLPKVEGNRSLNATPSPGLRPSSPSGRGAGGEGREAAITLRDDIIVITDEAHRTQYGTLALNLRNALPNAGYIGFTGTPLFTDDEITRRVFGNYVSTYDFQRAVEDKATVPLYYDARGDKLGVAIDDLNERIAENLEELENSPLPLGEGAGVRELQLDVQQRLEQEMKRDYHIITAGKRLDQIARDFVAHYAKAWETGKAMMVCIDKITCVRMHRLIEFYWDQHIRKLEKDLSSAVDEQDEQYRLRQIEWMRQTRMAVVVSEEQGEVEKFRKWDLDIIPHRRLIKEGMDLPEAMRRQPKFRNMQRLALDDAFKEAQHPFRIAIVCAMWLTGFDVPSLATLYLDKPLKAHTLMQAIARANRVHEGKNNGMIVDYCGILKNLRKALATFAGTGDGGRGGDGGETDPAKPEEELLADLDEAIAFVKLFLAERGALLDDIIAQTGFARNAAIVAAKEAANENDETRKRFEVMCRAVFTKFKACVTVAGVNAHRKDYEAISIIYRSLQEDREKADITDIIRQLHHVVDEAIAVQQERTAEEQKPFDISKIDFDRLRREFERSQAKRTSVQNLKEAIERRLQRLLRQNPLRTDFQRLYEQIVAEYNREKDRVTIEQTFEDLLRFVNEMTEEESRAVREGLDEESLAVFDLLKKPDLCAKEIERIKAVAVDLIEALKAEKLRVDHWQEKEATRDAVRLAIRDFLWSESTGLPVDRYTEDDVHARADEVYRHVYRVYPTVPSPYYEACAAA